MKVQIKCQQSVYDATVSSRVRLMSHLDRSPSSSFREQNVRRIFAGLIQSINAISIKKLDLQKLLIYVHVCVYKNFIIKNLWQLDIKIIIIITVIFSYINLEFIVIKRNFLLQIFCKFFRLS